MTETQDLSKRVRSCVCTKNNYSDENIQQLQQFAEDKCSYLVYGKEVGELNTPHLQIYFELRDPMSYKALNKKLPCGFYCHVMIALL